ncbi:MAG: ABC transporter ATP-binding protein [Candidatus Limiplasma sp.]|nr:ABC transporter ATP-binding protein [Candidatus Limiplasma sp.]
MPVSKAQQKAIHKYMKSAYDRMEIIIPKGQKDVLKAAARERGESLNDFTKKALLARMGLESWPEIEDKESGPDA